MKVLFFRFAVAVAIVVLIVSQGLILEKERLELRREVSQQQAETEILVEKEVRLRMEAHQLGAPAITHETLQTSHSKFHPSQVAQKRKSTSNHLLHLTHHPN